MARLQVVTGREGPAMDPYCWQQIKFTRTDGLVVLFRAGELGYRRLWCPARSKRMCIVSYVENMRECPACHGFELLTGLTPERAQKLPDEIERRYLRRLSSGERYIYEIIKEEDARMFRYAQ